MLFRIHDDGFCVLNWTYVCFRLLVIFYRRIGTLVTYLHINIVLTIHCIFFYALLFDMHPLYLLCSRSKFIHRDIFMASVPPSLTTPTTQNRKASSSSWTPQPRNPISTRLYKVLSTNFDDQATREALGTLSEVYASSKGKEAQTTTAVLEDGELEHFEHGRQGDGAVVVEEEEVPGELAAQARKSMRKGMENKLMEGSQHFVMALMEVDEVCFFFLSDALVQ